MLAVSKGRLIEMSSPNGKRGHFYENWQHGTDVERIKIIGRECPRIGAEFLDKMRQKLGPLLFAQEFAGEFIDAESSAFSNSLWSTSGSSVGCGSNGIPRSRSIRCSSAIAARGLKV
jgi:hypothetical protein